MTPVEELREVAKRWAEELLASYPWTVGAPAAEMKTEDEWTTARIIVTIPLTRTERPLDR